MLTKSPQTCRSWILPLTLLLFSFTLRIFLISKGPYHVDCLALAINAQKTYTDHTLHYQFGTGYPLTVLAGTLFIGLTNFFSINDPVFAVNLMSVWLSSLTVLIFFLLLKNTFNKLTAFLGATALSLHPIFLTLSVYGNSHVVSLFFFLLSLYFLTHSQIKYKNILFPLSLGLMGAARLQDMALILIPTGILWFKTQKNFQLKTFLNCFVAAIVIAISFHLPYLSGDGQSSYTSQLKNFIALGLTSNFLGLFSSYLPKSIHVIFFTTTYVSTVIAGFGLYKIYQVTPRIGVFLTAWFLCPLLFYGNVMTLVPRFLLIATVPVIIAAAYGFHLLLINKSSLQKIVVGAAFILMLALPLVTNILPILQFRHTHALLPDWAAFIGKNTEHNAEIIVGDEQLFVIYYGKRRTFWRDINSFEGQPEEFAKFKDSLSANLNNNIPLYITESALCTSDPAQGLLNYMRNNYRLEPRGKQKIENWHSGEMQLEIVPDSLYRIYQN